MAFSDEEQAIGIVTGAALSRRQRAWLVPAIASALASARAEATAAEMERACAAACPRCAEGWPLYGDSHTGGNGGLYTCHAAPIRAANAEDRRG